MTSESRPYIICFMTASIDGKLRTQRYSKSYYSDDYLNEYDLIASNDLTYAGGLKRQAIIIGRLTYYEDCCKKEFDYLKYSPASTFVPHKAKSTTEIYAIITDSKGKSIYDDNKAFGYNVIAVLGETVSEEYLRYLRERDVSYVFAGKDGHNFHKALKQLQEVFGLERLMLEGGGAINGSFLKMGLIDEIAVMISPSIDGLAGEPSIFEYQGKPDELPAEGQRLELLSTKTYNYGIVLIHYKVHRT